MGKDLRSPAWRQSRSPRRRESSPRLYTRSHRTPERQPRIDVGNVIQYGYPDQWIRILEKKRLLNIHLKDYSESVNNIRAFTYLFQGSVPWKRVMGALRDVGYDGYLIAEVPPYPFCPEEGIWDLSRKMDILINGTFE
jgi:hypothetical protein